MIPPHPRFPSHHRLPLCVLRLRVKINPLDQIAPTSLSGPLFTIAICGLATLFLHLMYD